MSIHHLQVLLSLLFERLSANKIRRGIEEYEQGKVYRVKEGDC